ncbi:MAG: glyoxalase [Firmicutes bacterium]|nr:glyoxalase [Bacillota bacterium]
MLLRKVEHIGINVSDMDRSIKFYTEVLGLNLRTRVRLSEQSELAFLAIGDAELELVATGGAIEHARQGVVNHLAFTVDDVSTVLAHLKKHAVHLLNDEPIVIEPLGVKIAFFHGPDGEKLELFSAPG